MRRKSALAERAYLLCHPDIIDVNHMMAYGPGYLDLRNQALILRLFHLRRWIWNCQRKILEAGETYDWCDVEIVVPGAWGHFGHEPELQLSGSTFLGMDVVRDPKADRFTVRVKAVA